MEMRFFSSVVGLWIKIYQLNDRGLYTLWRGPWYYSDVTTVDKLECRQEHQSQVLRRGTFVRRGQFVLSYYRGHDCFQLKHAVFDPNAISVSRAERYERVRMTAAARVRQEVVRVEFLWVGVILCARLQEQRGDHQRGTFKTCDSIVKFHVSSRISFA